MRALGLFAAVLTSLMVAAPAGADEPPTKAGDLVISQAVVRASLGHTPNTAAYLTISNTGAAPERLISVSCACAAKVVPHAMQQMGGMMMMMDEPGPLVIPAHGAVKFSPGGRHLMLTGLKATLADGGHQAMTLVFDHVGAVTVSFEIKDKIPG